MSSVVPFPKCPICDRSVVGLVKVSDGRRQVVHLQRADPDRCTVSLEAYAELCEWFANMHAKGAVQARHELAMEKESAKGTP